MSQVLSFSNCCTTRVITKIIQFNVIILISALSERDHLKINQYLKFMEDKDIILLGQALGLERSKLKKMKDLPGAMIDAWLNQEDDVLATSGPPTWDSLSKALREIDQIGIAARIEGM